MPKYKVCGDRKVFGTVPGDTFDADLSEFDEDRLIVGGHIEKQGQKPTGKSKSEED